MRVLITTKRFPPEVPATAVLGQELAESLDREDFQVTVAAGYPHHPYGRIFDGYQPNLVSVSQQNGFRLIRAWHLVHPSPATAVRALAMASQCCSYFLSALKAARPDVVISFDGYPLLGPLSSALIARLTGAKLVSVIYDLYPDIAAELGHLSNPALISLAKRLEKLSYDLSHRVVVLSEGFRRTLSHDKGVAPAKIAVIPVWLDARDIVPMSRDNPWRREMGLGSEKFVVLYAGTIGLVSGAAVVLEAAQHLASQMDFLFLLVGDGYGKEQVMIKARELGLTNLRFLPFQPRERLSELQATADVSLVTLGPGRGRTSVPSKVLGYMAAARPVVASVDLDCDTADLIRQAQCGRVVPAGDGQALAQAVWDYYQNPLERQSAGNQGRHFFLEHFERQAVLHKFLELIREFSPRP